MRLIDADKLLETLQDLEPHCDNKDYEYGMLNTIRYYMPKIINDEPTAYDVDKIIEKLEEIRVKKTCNKEKCNTKELCRICVVDDAIEIVKQETATYEECYKDCGECEAYNKEKHHCPKFCKLIKETVKEIEENHNGWIPCSVRIPTEQERWLGHDLTDAEPREFIVMVKGAYEPTTGYYHSGYGCWVKDLTSEYDDKNTSYGNEIVAWRFFPQPYQPKGENDENI